MPDLLVKLYDLPEIESASQFATRTGITIRRAISPEKHVVTDWVQQTFNEAWKSECEIAFARSPISCLLAIEQSQLIGFACYDVTMKGFFGPTGVDKQARGKGVGKTLLLHALHSMKQEGYGYAIIGGAGPVEFYAKWCDAIPIEGSEPGIYRGVLKRP